MAKVKKDNALEVKKVQLPANLEELEAAAGDGLDFGADDMQIPFLSVLQSGNPQVKRSDPNYIQGAQEGMIFNSLTYEIFNGDEGVLVIPCVYRKQTNEWRLRSAGGGFVDSRPYDPEEFKRDAQKDADGKFILPNGNQIIETAEYFVLIVKDDGSVDRAILSMTSSQLGVSRRLNALLSKIQLPKKNGGFFTPPLYANLVRLKTLARSNNDYSWFVFDPQIEGFAPVELIQLAQEFSQSVREGAVEVKRTQDPGATSAASDITDDDTPF